MEDVKDDAVDNCGFFSKKNECYLKTYNATKNEGKKWTSNAHVYHETKENTRKRTLAWWVKANNCKGKIVDLKLCISLHVIFVEIQKFANSSERNKGHTNSRRKIYHNMSANLCYFRVNRWKIARNFQQSIKILPKLTPMVLKRWFLF